MSIIIGFCGRCQSGKSELANICEKYNFNKLSFATPLKQLVAKLLNCTIEDVNRLKNTKIDFICDADKCDVISKECEIPLNIVNDTMLNKQFENSRQILQFIGTNLIRNYNNDWHVNKMKLMIDKDKNYVIDDVRFPNEANLIKELNGDLWFIVRPKIDNVSNHESETSLKWQNFENIIINNGSLEYLQSRWKMFFENNYKEQLIKKHEIEKRINEDNILKNKIKTNQENGTLLDALFINKEFYTYKKPIIENFINLKIINNKIYAENNKLECFELTNPLEIEDLKLIL